MAEQSIADYIQQNLAPKEQKINDFLSSAAKTVASPAPKPAQQQTPTIQNAPSPTGQPIGIPQPQMLDSSAVMQQGISQYVNGLMAAGVSPSGITNEDITKLSQNYIDKTYGANIAKDQTAYSAQVDLAKNAINKQLDLWTKQQEQGVVNRPDPKQIQEQKTFGVMTDFLDNARTLWDKTQEDVSKNIAIPYGGNARSAWVGGSDAARYMVGSINAYESMKDGFSRVMAASENVLPGADSKPAVAESIHQMFPGPRDNNLSGSMKLYNAYSMALQEAIENKTALVNGKTSAAGWDDLIGRLQKGRQTLEDKYLPVWKANRMAPWADSGQSEQSNQPAAKPSSLPGNSGLSPQSQQLIRQQAQQGIAPNGQ